MAAAHDCHHKSVMIDGKNFRTVTDECWDIERRQEAMARMEIARQVLSPMPELLSYWLPLEDALPLTRHVNDTIAAMVARAPDKFIGLGARADAGPGCGRARTRKADARRLLRRRARQQYQWRAARRSEIRQFLCRRRGTGRGDFRACAASGRQGAHRRTARADGLYRLSARDRLLHRLADHRRHADAPPAPAAGLQPWRRRLCLDPAAPGARAGPSIRSFAERIGVSPYEHAPQALLRHAGL